MLITKTVYKINWTVEYINKIKLFYCIIYINNDNGLKSVQRNKNKR